MARSIRKTPIFGITTTVSEKADKRRWNKTFRRISKQKIERNHELPVNINAVTNVWDGRKDGKHYWNGYSAKDMRK